MEVVAAEVLEVEGKPVPVGCQVEHSVAGGHGSAAAGHHRTGSLEGCDGLGLLGEAVQLGETRMGVEPAV